MIFDPRELSSILLAYTLISSGFMGTVPEIRANMKSPELFIYILLIHLIFYIIEFDWNSIVCIEDTNIVQLEKKVHYSMI